jgi:hypothetical protein
MRVRSGAADDWVVLISHHQKSRKGRVENWVVTENAFLSTENLANLRGIRF